MHFESVSFKNLCTAKFSLFIEIIYMYYSPAGHAVAYLGEALRYKLDGSGSSPG
jgi:hypothetical protein